MAEYTFKELTDMHLTYGEAKENGCETGRLCEHRFPIRRIPSHPIPFPVLIDDCEKPIRLSSQTAMKDVREMHERQK